MKIHPANNLTGTRPHQSFSHNTANGVKESIKAMFGAQVIKPHESYLGLPSLVGRSKRNTFAQLKQWMSNKLAGWKERLLSNARKEVLIKAATKASRRIR